MLCLEPFQEAQEFKAVKRCSWCPARDILAIISDDGDLELYRLWELAIVLEKGTNLEFLAWSPDGKTLAALGSNGSGKLFDIEAGRNSLISFPLEDSDAISTLQWTNISNQMTLLLAGTNAGRLIARLGGTLLVRNIELNDRVLHTTVLPNSLSTTSIVQGDSLKLIHDNCKLHDLELLEVISSKCHAIDTLLSSASQNFGKLLKDVKHWETSCLQDFQSKMLDAFSDFEEPPKLLDWEILAVFGRTEVNIVQTLSRKLLPKHFRTWNHISEQTHERIIRYLQSLFGDLEQIIIITLEISIISSQLFDISRKCKEQEKIILDIFEKLKNLEDCFIFGYCGFLEFVKWLDNAIKALKAEDSAPCPPYDSIKKWFDEIPFGNMLKDLENDLTSLSANLDAMFDVSTSFQSDRAVYDLGNRSFLVGNDHFYTKDAQAGNFN